MKTQFRNIVFGFLVPMSNFVVDPFLGEANEDYRKERYKEAYQKFSSYLFYNANGSSIQDYYIALMGKGSCMMHLDSKELFYIERSFFSQLMDSDLTEPQLQVLVDILSNSVYWDLTE